MSLTIIQWSLCETRHVYMFNMSTSKYQHRRLLVMFVSPWTEELLHRSQQVTSVTWRIGRSQSIESDGGIQGRWRCFVKNALRIVPYIWRAKNGSDFRAKYGTPEAGAISGMFFSNVNRGQYLTIHKENWFCGVTDFSKYLKIQIIYYYFTWSTHTTGYMICWYSELWAT